jgi:hypothetical protein
MAVAFGEVDVEHGGKTYTLRLTMRGVAALQDEFGQNLDPILSLKSGQLPHFGVCLRVVELALQKHHPDATKDLADDILSDDMGVFARVIAAAFPQPDAAASGGAEPGKRTAAA